MSTCCAMPAPAPSGWGLDSSFEVYLQQAVWVRCEIPRNSTNTDKRASSEPYRRLRLPRKRKMNKNSIITMISSLKRGETSTPRVMYIMTFWTTSRYLTTSFCNSPFRSNVLHVNISHNNTYLSSLTSLFFAPEAAMPICWIESHRNWQAVNFKQPLIKFNFAKGPERLSLLKRFIMGATTSAFLSPQELDDYQDCTFFTKKVGIRFACCLFFEKKTNSTYTFRKFFTSTSDSVIWSETAVPIMMERFDSPRKRLKTFLSSRYAPFIFISLSLLGESICG